MLTREQVNHWKEEGYVIIPDFFNSEEVALMREEMENLCENGHGRNPVTDGDGETSSKKAINLQIIPLRDKSELFKGLPFIPKVKHALTNLLGPNVVQVLDQIFLKPAKSGAATGWHTDNAYFNTPDPTKGTGLWIALHDANEANGTMRVIPKSHLQELKHVRDMNSDHHITCATEIDPSQSVLVEVPAGGCIFFNFAVAHATGDNPTDKPRAGAAFHYATPELARQGNDHWQNTCTVLHGEDKDNHFKPYEEQPALNLWESEKKSISVS